MSKDEIVCVKQISKYYESEAGTVKALDQISATIYGEQLVAVVGTSGSGKSTFLHMLGGLDFVTSGEVLIQGESLQKMKKQQLTDFRRKNIGFVFQKYNLIPSLSVLDNITLPVELDNQKVDMNYVNELLDILEIKDKKDCFNNQLSGGQQQRVAIARALIMKPKIVLADEPTGNLDCKNAKYVIDLLKRTKQQLRQTVVLVTHDNEIAHQCERILTIEDGKIVNDMMNHVNP